MVFTANIKKKLPNINVLQYYSYLFYVCKHLMCWLIRGWWDARDIFPVFSGAEIQPFTQWNLGDFFPNIEKKSQSSKKIFFLKIGIFIQSTHTHKLHGDDQLPLHLISPSIWRQKHVKSLICIFIDQKWHKCVLWKFPNLGVYHASYTNVKGPRAPSQNSKKNPWMLPLVFLWRGRNMALKLPFVWQRACFQLKVQGGMCMQQRFKSIYALAQYDQSLSFLPEETLDSWLPIECLLSVTSHINCIVALCLINGMCLCQVMMTLHL